MSQFIAMQAPPGNVLSSYDRSVGYADQNDELIPPTFLDAMSVRQEVFVKEQKVELDRELDEDDPRSWHWVTYASVGSTSGTQNSDPNAKRGSVASRLPVGTIRLVPPPHPPHPKPGSSHLIDNSEVPRHDLTSPHTPGQPQSRSESSEDNSAATSFHNPYEEPYIKLGRLATLAQYRKLGLGKLLLDSALDWAAKHPFDILPPPSATQREQARAEGGGEGLQEIENEKWRGLVLVHSQKHQEGLYTKWGFVTDEAMGEWDEEGISHIGMWKRIAIQEK